MRKVFLTITDNYFIKDIKAEDGSVLARYTHSGLRTDDVLAVDISSSGVSRGLASQSGSYFYLKDGLGSVQAITTESGNLVQRYIYSSFGKLLKVVDAAGLETTSFKTPFTYTNRELDEESGLYYFRARYYDPSIGRFLQEDPHPGIGLNPGTVVQTYAYVLNNPINDTDPEGRIGPLAIIGVAAIVGAVVGGGAYVLRGGKFEWGELGKSMAVGALSGAIGATVAITVGGGGGALLGGFAGGFSGGSFSALFNGENPFTEKNLLKSTFAGLFGMAGAGFGYAIGTSMLGTSHAAAREFSIGVSTGLPAAAGSAITDEATERVFKLLVPVM